MSAHPANLLLRFALEVIALVVVGQWGWQQPEGPMRYVYTFGLPLLLAAVWGIFRYPGDIAQMKKPPVAVSGKVRLLIELLVFGVAVWSCFAAGRAFFGVVYGFTLLLHYFLSLDRVIRMWRNQKVVPGE